MLYNCNMDVLAVTLKILQRIPRGGMTLVKVEAKKNPKLFVESVKKLIDTGYSEYEFSEDYTAIKRLDLPDFARFSFWKKQHFKGKVKK